MDATVETPEKTVVKADAAASRDTSDAFSVQVGETQSWDPKSTKTLLRKLDWHIIPFMSLIYLSVLGLAPPLFPFPPRRWRRGVVNPGMRKLEVYAFSTAPT